MTIKNPDEKDKNPYFGKSSPHAETVGPLYGLTVSQQKAAVMSEPLQQPLCDHASDLPVIDGLDEDSFSLHVASEAFVFLVEVQQTAAVSM